MDSQALQSQVVGDVNLKDDEDICSICFDPLDEGPTQILDCKHIFHRSCIKKFRETAIAPRCPICRGSLPPTSDMIAMQAWSRFKPLENRAWNDGPLTRRERGQLNEAVRLWEEAAEEDNLNAQFNLGSLYYYGYFLEENHNKAAEWFTKASECGHCASQHYLGCMYYMGQGVIRDFKKAIYWISKSTQNANVWEHSNIIKENSIILGRMYYHGYGVRVNYKKAFELYERRAIVDNNPEAQDVLGTMFLNGWGGVKKNYRTAYKWFKKGANNGDSNAQFNMGDMYHKGKYVKKNHVKAIRWFEKALEQGHEEAKKRLDRIIAKQKKQTKTNVD
tara:strand:- start:765 stop:1763 length:999 start_codon:yes stop_codon:yes gene_type:complete